MGCFLKQRSLSVLQECLQVCQSSQPKAETMLIQALAVAQRPPTQPSPPHSDLRVYAPLPYRPPLRRKEGGLTAGQPILGFPSDIWL